MFRIGLHAPRNAGKTCLFACLYGLRHLLSDQVLFDDEATLTYLKAAWKHIKEGQVPPATAMTRPTRLAWQLTSGGETWRLVSSDYPGALVEPSADGTAKELRAEAKDWFRSCDALLILVDSSAPDVEQLDVVELLLAELRREAAAGKPARPLGLVLTKWDTQGTISADREEERDRLQKYLLEHPVFSRIRELLKTGGGRFEVFTVSAFGLPGPAPGEAPPVEKMRPYNLLAPWKWAAGQSRSAVRADRKGRAKRRLKSAQVLALALILAGVGVYVYAENRAGESHQVVIAYAKAHPSPDRAAERVRHEQWFLSRWYSFAAPRLREATQNDLHSDRVAADLYARQERQTQRLKEIQTDGRRLIDTDPARAYKLCESFLDEFPDAPQKQSVRQLQLEALQAWQAAARQRKDAANPRDHAAYAAALHEFMSVPGIPADEAAAARASLSKLEAEWDEAEYAALLNEFRRGVKDGKPVSDPEILEGVDRLAAAYLESSRKLKAMTPAVTGWRSWFAGLTSDRDYTIRVKSVNVPRKSDLDSWLGTDLRVRVTLGEQSYRTKAYKTLNPTMLEDLGPYRFRWGSPTRLEVVVQNYFSVLNNDETAPAVLIDDRFVLGKANGTVKMKCVKGMDVAVELECPQAVPPVPPPYQAERRP
ncbi:MAG: GTPase domain-containing protein [Gemmataceae bacterium]